MTDGPRRAESDACRKEPDSSLSILVTLIWRWLLAPALFGRRGGLVASRLGADLPAAILSAAAPALLLGALTLPASADAQQAGARGGPPLLLRDAVVIEEGKRADLVALRENPLERSGATRSIEWVMKDGVLHRPQELLEGLVATRLPSPGQP